jgi:HTH-type transcriptional regulator/antitoxin HigA
MSNSVLLEPRWASAPGETILEALRERGNSVDDLAEWLQLSDPQTRRLLSGDTQIDGRTASALALHIGGSEAFWTGRETRYQEHLSWVSADALAERLPVAELVKRGWLQKTTNWRERAKACLDFFGVTTEAEWNQVYGSPLANANFRRSARLQVSDTAVAAWLRRAEIESDGAVVAAWSAPAFRRALDEIRGLTRVNDPEQFVPTLQALCSEAGVAVVVLATPKDCPVSGAALFTRQDIPMIVLSARYLSDDHFWFTFFHEAGHLLMHDVESSPFLDELGPDAADRSNAEVEADEFARAVLLDPKIGHIEMRRLSGPTMREIVVFASRQGISPGIVVGQLQHDGVFGFERRNDLKRKYRWDGPTLKSARP